MSCLANGGSTGVDTKMSLHEESVEEFKGILYKMQGVRRKIVVSIQQTGTPNTDDVEVLRSTLTLLEDERTNAESVRHMTAASQSFSVNIKDEVIGLRKDIVFLERLCSADPCTHRTVDSVFALVDLPDILAPYHPVSIDKFNEEMDNVVAFLTRLLSNLSTKIAFITDWDGTMKNYCSQYATNLQPVYSAIGMAQFASCYTRLTAVLTAGPLRGPGILDLTALPIDGPIVFSGSWGREWWLGGRRVVYADGISEEEVDTLERFNDEMRSLLHEGEYSQFGLVGSGMQRKVDRLTLGVQTVCSQVEEDLSSRYQDAVKERMHRVDPNQQVLIFEKATDLEVEVCLHSSGSVWSKGDGVDRLLHATGNCLEEGRVLIAGDTKSDLPMLEYSLKHNPKETFALFVGQSPSLKESVRSLVSDDSRVCCISCPDVFHAALSKVLVANKDID